MAIKKSSEISKESLEKIVKTSGDDIVTGYVRFRKIKPVKGYKKAEERARLHISKIIKGRALKNGTYAAVVRFRLIVFILPLLLIGLFFLIRQFNIKGLEKEPDVYISPEVPTVNMADDYEGFYISVPGMVLAEVNSLNPEIYVYNPADNECSLRYEAYFEGELIGSSELILPGAEGHIILNKIPEAENLKVNVIASGYSNDGKTAYNKISQIVKLIVA